MRGNEIIVSRAHKGLVEGLFDREVPEVAQKSVELRVVAREAGNRTKVAVYSTAPGVDPVGSCVGQKGVRVQAVINELGGNEKVDIIQWSDDMKQFVMAALAPAKDMEVTLDEKKQVASVLVPDDQLSLAIGRDGGNVRLAAKLTGWKIDIKGKGGSAPVAEEPAKEEAAATETEAAPAKEEKSETPELAPDVAKEVVADAAAEEKVEEAAESAPDEPTITEPVQQASTDTKES